jgi:hypothetical protein
MEEVITDDVLDFFEKITLIDIRAFFEEFVNFMDNDYDNIVALFSGNTTVLVSDSFENLRKLTEAQKDIIDVFDANASSFGYDGWILLELVEQIGQELSTTNNLDKWMRSSKTFSKFSPGEINYMQRQGQTLEQIESQISASTNSEEDWVALSLRNELREEDYTLKGGTVVKINLKNNNSIFLNSVVDNIDSVEKTFGIDIDRNIKIVNDDLVVLSPKETIEQAADIAGGLNRGDNPQFPNDGINVKGFVGNSGAALAYPAVFRQLSSNFAKDDTFKSIEIIKVDKKSDARFIEYNINTIAGDPITRQLLI